MVAIRAGTILTPVWGKNEASPEDAAYLVARDFLLSVFSHQLTCSGVPAETVADPIAEVDRAWGICGRIVRSAGRNS